MKKAGKAYGFFYCSASKEEIGADLPNIRHAAETPSQLEISLIEGVENLKGDKGLMALARAAKESGDNYVIEATYPGETNEKTARELWDILSMAYTGSELYPKGEEFKGDVVYKLLNKYVCIE